MSVDVFGISRRVLLPLLLLFFLIGKSALAKEVGTEKPTEPLTFEEALRSGKPHLSVRLRFEDVSQDNLLDDAGVLTTRAKLGYQTAAWHGLSGLLEFEANEAWGGEAYNSGPPPNGNGKTRFSVIPDPEGTEVNQWYLQYEGLVPQTRFRLGRQRIIYDNARFVGNVGWRQNEQTYDAFSIRNQSLPWLSLNYSYLDQSNDIFFRDIEMSSHLFNVALMPEGAAHQLVGYGYILDFDLPLMTDHKTLGLRGKGSFDLSPVTLGYTLEYAKQDDTADAPDTVDADYYLVEFSLAQGGLKGWAGIEVLGGDGVYGFSTPLATLHAFNGWADQFLFTPPTGLEDRYIGASWKLPISTAPVTLKAIYHDFVSDTGGLNYGDEWNLAAVWKFAKGWSALAKFADYSAEDRGVDTQKIWLQLEYGF